MKEAVLIDRDDMKYGELWVCSALCLSNTVVVNKQCRSFGRAKKKKS